ncbi:MAG TPA: DUF2867 domain-containing protein [Actinomycetota bacterium]|nr:DUF2867 domain-containing protein [Actinomycetota bacterium]
MRLPRSEHTSRPWRIHDVAHDFRLEDVWALPTPGGPGDFPRLVEMVAALDPAQTSSPVVRMLFTIRLRMGALLGWDDESSGVGERVPSLRERLPDDLRDTVSPAPFEAAPFEPLYRTDDEFAAEVANRTVHGVLHVGWVRADDGGYRGQLAILVKPNGLLGSAYMAGITPFRHFLVYPTMMREFGRAWEAAR